MSEEQQSLEIEVRKWDAHSFTIEGENDQLEKLLQEQKIIRTLALRHNGKMVRISRDVRLKARGDFYFMPEAKTTAIENICFIRVQCLSTKDVTDSFCVSKKKYTIKGVYIGQSGGYGIATGFSDNYTKTSSIQYRIFPE